MRTCIFCEARAGSREHLWPQWVLQKIKPGRIQGFVGRHKNLTFHREFVVKSVCGTCNGGWMSNLESAIMPVLGSMIDDKSITLDKQHQLTVAAWALKTAMLMDATTAADVPLFYTKQERESLRDSRLIPVTTTVWLGRYFGRRDIGAHWSRVVFRYANAVAPSRVATFVLGNLTLQVMTMHPPTQFLHSNIVVEPRQGPWDEILATAWPRRQALLYWPPVLAFDDSRTLVDLSVLPDRWHVGAEDAIVG